jgi:hypothetical protein
MTADEMEIAFVAGAVAQNIGVTARTERLSVGANQYRAAFAFLQRFAQKLLKQLRHGVVHCIVSLGAIQCNDAQGSFALAQHFVGHCHSSPQPIFDISLAPVI